MKVIELLLLILQLAIRIWDARKEKNDETKKKRVEILQQGLKAIVDGDVSAITASFIQLDRLSK